MSRQLLAGTFEHALDYLIGNKLYLSGFGGRNLNKCTGANAYLERLRLRGSEQKAKQLTAKT